MNKLSKYCKAYPIDVFLDFEKWDIQLPYRYTISDTYNENVTIEKILDFGDYVFLHDSYRVTIDIFPDKNIIFESMDEEFKQFCKDKLDFAYEK